MHLRALFLVLLLGALGAGLSGCQNYTDQLQRSQRYYDENQYETALAVLRNLELDQESLDATERVRYCYLRGMTDYRLAYRADARYWLGLARAAERYATGALTEPESARIEEALSDLNREVYGSAAGPASVPADAPADATNSGAAANGGSGDPAVKPCQWSSECKQGFICQSGACVQVE